MKKILAAVSLGVAALAIAACGPDNVGACTSAQEALDAAYADCEIDTTTDLSCDTYADYSADCTEYFNTIADSAACTDGTVDWDSSGSCV